MGQRPPESQRFFQMPSDHPFALCLTHDVDRVRKTLPQTLYHATADRDLSHFRRLFSGDNPYWQFEDVMALEDDLDVRSAFYFLQEPNLVLEKHPRNMLRPDCWVQHLGRYDIHAPEIVDIIRRLDDGGWEIGLHGSYDSYRDRDRLEHEKTTLESVLGRDVLGGRQHYLRLDIPETWTYHTEAGFAYDTSLGSSTEYGFQHGYDVTHPFDDEFTVFPLTAMEVALMDDADGVEDAWRRCERLLADAEANDAVMTVLWHPRLFNETEFPGYRRLYRRLVETAIDRGAWVGPPGDYYREFVASTPDHVGQTY